MAEEKIKIAPEICSFVDDVHSKLSLEISIPGVQKENITLKMHDEGFSLSALREDIEYVTTSTFCCPVDIEKVEANYQNGLLKITVPFKEIMEGAVKVHVT